MRGTHQVQQIKFILHMKAPSRKIQAGADCHPNDAKQKGARWV
jgi:hypothetical protein